MRRPWRWLRMKLGSSSLRTRLALTLALALAPPVALGIGQGYYNYRDQRLAAERNLVQTARLVTAEYQSLMANAHKVLTTLVAQPEVRNLSMPACGAALRNALALLPEYELALAIDANGTIRCGSRDVDRRIVASDWPWFQAAMQGAEFTVADFAPNAVIDGRTLVAAIPVQNAAGRRTGVLALFINFDTLGGLSEHRDSATRTYLSILDPDGNELPLEEAAPFITPGLRRLLVAEGSRQEIAVHRNLNRQGRETMYVVSALPFTNLYAVLAQPSQSIFAWLGVKLGADLLSPLLIWLVAIGTAGLAMHRLVLRWMLQLRHLVMRSLYGQGEERDGQNVDYKSQTFAEAPQEVKELAESFIAMMRTIEARNAQLKDAVAHRDMLIKEIHHRVKNNLQIISSLLNLQSRTLQDDTARETLLGLQSRVNALALIHQSLYETQEQQVVELQGFLEPLCHQLEELAAGRQIYILSEVPRYYVSAETAVTLAMLVTEIVANATKHAFRNQKSGRVLIELLTTSESGPATLVVSDNGSGGFSLESSTRGQGLGRELIKGYVRQLQGELSVEQRDGTRVSITFQSLR